jgi:hypothetical protein
MDPIEAQAARSIAATKAHGARNEAVLASQLRARRTRNLIERASALEPVTPDMGLGKASANDDVTDLLKQSGIDIESGENPFTGSGQ